MQRRYVGHNLRHARPALSLPISDYALIGDTHSTALVARDGSIDWLCWPRHDSPALFLRLLDDEKGGCCRLHLSDLRATTRRYLPGTNVLETTFTTATGTARLTDLMPVSPPSPEPDEGPDGEGESRLIRLLTCDDGRVEGRFCVHPTFDYARCDCVPCETGGSILFEAGDQRLRAMGSGRLTLEGPSAWLDVSLEAGQSAYLVLTHGEDDERAGIEDWEGACRRLDQTRTYWERWSGQCRYDGPIARRSCEARSA